MGEGRRTSRALHHPGGLVVAILTLGLLERDGGLVCSLVVLVDKLWGRWLLCLVGTHTWLLEWTVSHVLDVMIQELRVS